MLISMKVILVLHQVARYIIIIIIRSILTI